MPLGREEKLQMMASLNWVEIIREAQEKVMGLEIPIICEILTGMPQGEFEAINWTRNPGWDVFRGDIGLVQ